MGSALEYRALTTAARDNLRATYMGLALCLPGARLEHDRWPTVCVGPGLPTFANFAMEFDAPHHWDAVEEVIQRCSVRTDRFWVFHCDADQDKQLRTRMMRGGFLYRHRLAMLAWEGDAPETFATLRQTTNREETAQFMVNQFFRTSATEMKEAIVASTVRSGHALWYAGAGGAAVGAVMTVATPGVLGLYNLCVDAAHRGLGTGSAIVRAVQAMAAAEKRNVVLQCDESLVGWYERLGFKRLGEVETWSGIATAPSSGEPRLA